MWEEILYYVAIGFIAQLVDGALGMAYGVTASSVLLGMGVAPATASACVHAAETFTTGASGLAHWRLGNVDRDLMKRLVLPGMIGGILGTYILALLPGDVLRPYIACYLLLLGLDILWKAATARRPHATPGPKLVAPLGFFGGLLDSIGGGGWGPIVTSTLIGQGTNPRYAIGSVNTAEFFVTLTITLSFVLGIGLELYPIIVGLVLGGIIAAPIAALTTKHIPAGILMTIVGIVIVGLSVRTIAKLAMA